MTELKETSKASENPLVTVDGFKLKKLSIISTFSDIKKIDAVIAKFSKEALSVVPDLSTAKSRAEIASIAYKISKKKTNITGQMIDPSIEEAKALVRSVNDGKKHFMAKMDNLRDEVRGPLNKWEAEEKIKEEKRISEIELKICGISNIALFDQNNMPDKEEVSDLIEAVDAVDCEQGFDEFTQDALQAKSKAKEILTDMLNQIIQKEMQEKAAEELELKEAEIEAGRLKQVAQERLNTLMMIPVGMFGKTSAEIKSKIDKIKDVEIKESEFGELHQNAVAAVEQVNTQLATMFNQQLLVEQANALQEEQRITNEQVKAVAQGTVGEVILTDKTIEINTQEQSDNFAFDEKPVETQTRKVHGSSITKRELTPHEEQLSRVKFWANQYGVHGGMYSDLINILNQYQ
tara:strand:+ start:2345 stop:3559 length:1215 start_codon:yes stop_codon:yes gene_type:complete